MLTLGLAGNTGALCLAPIATEFHLTDAQSGFFLSCVFWGAVASILVAGPLADRMGFRLLMVVAAFLEAAGMAFVSASWRVWGVYLGAALAGCGMGVFDALATPLACAVYPEARARTANLVHSFYPLGMFCIVLLVMLLTRMGWAWRGIYLLVGLVCIPVGLLFLFMPLPERSHEGTERLRARRLVLMPPFLLLLAAILLAGTTEIGFTQWLPAYIERAASGGRFAGAMALLVLGVTMTAGRMGNSLLVHRIRPRVLWIAGACMCVAALLLAAIPIALPLRILCGGVFGIGISGLWPNTLAMAGDRFPEAGASMYSLLHALGNMGGFVGPVLIGVVAQWTNLRVGIAALAVAPALALVVIKFAQDHVREQKVT
jgi:fucose permease